MRLRALRIENFRGIDVFEVTNLRDLVVIAGPNGCGKTCVLDGIRLLKSFYGGYVVNEWQTWFGEFQIDITSPEGMLRLLRDRGRPLQISAEIELSDTDRSYLQNHAEDALRPLIWQRLLGRNVGWSRQIVSAEEITQYGQKVETDIQEGAATIRNALGNEFHQAGLIITPQSQIALDPEPVLQLIFQTYSPHDLGVIDYHSSSRVYEREALGAVNLSLDQTTQQRRQQSLYNWREKYKNVKTELAANYVLGIIAKESGASTIPDLNSTLAELFHTFFPGKEYRGPVPQADGLLTFPVHLESGGQHDVDELSSGEKELLYGYLRLRNSAPRSSVILLDEPELHLNPRLLQGLPDFYHANLGRALNNQLWLITHSDSILRQAVGNPNYSAFHMSVPQSAQPADHENQAAIVTANSELDQAVVDIVGDLAAYKPRAKVVILEGGGDTETDVEIVSRLFPAWGQSVNLVPGGSKRRVRDLYKILETTTQRAGLSERFFAIVDRDRESENLPLQDNVYRWDRYHIENYFLEPDYLATACKTVLGSRSLLEGAALDQALLDCARSLVHGLVLERLQDEINDGLVSALTIKASPNTRNPAADLMPAIQGSLARLREVGDRYSDEAFLATKESEIRSALDLALSNGEWRREFPGRLILKRFVGQHIIGINYDAFRYVVLDKMVDAGYQPPGMTAVIERIISAT